MTDTKSVLPLALDRFLDHRVERGVEQALYQRVGRVVGIRGLVCVVGELRTGKARTVGADLRCEPVLGAAGIDLAYWEVPGHHNSFAPFGFAAKESRTSSALSRSHSSAATTTPTGWPWLERVGFPFM